MCASDIDISHCFRYPGHSTNRAYQFPVRQKMGTHRSDSCIRHTAVYLNEHIRHGRCNHTRRADRLSCLCLSCKSCKTQAPRRCGVRCQSACRHSVGCVRPCGYVGACSGHSQCVQPCRRFRPLGRNNRTCDYDSALDHKSVYDCS